MLKFFSSLPLAIFLIASIAGMSVVATMVGNTTVYTSIPFLGLVLAFAINLTLCTIKMLPKLRAAWKRSAADLSGDGASYVLYRSQDGRPAVDEVRGMLQKERYRISEADAAGQSKMLAVKGRLSLPAPHLLHIAILVVMAGAVLTSFSESGGVVAYIGQSSPMTTTIRQMIGDGSAEKLAKGEKGDDYIQVLDFQTLYDTKGAVENWVTHFNMFIDNEQVAANGETRVNFPYQYKNIRVYQNSYGYQYAVEIKGGSDAGEYSVPDGSHLALGDGSKEFMMADLGDGRTLLKVFDVSAGEANETVIIGKVVKVGDIVEVEPGVTIEYLMPNPYTVLEVKVSYGTPMVFAGFILAIVASMLFWAGRYREIRVLSADRADEVLIWVVCKNKMVVDKIQQRLNENLIKEAK